MKRLIRGRVNIGQPSYTPLAYVNQLDDITLELDVYNGNSPLDVTGQTVSLYAKRSNTTVVEQLSGLSTASTKVTGDVKNSCFAVPGITEMQLEFTDSTGKTTVSSFYINVNKSLSSEDSITAGNEIAILTEAKKMEPIRQENERGRVEAEKLRVQAETDRAAAEEIREQQELARQTCYKEIEESRKDFDGGIHKNLKLRLMRDFGDIYERFNKANLLPYEAEYISASNSYKGMTTDNVVKGRTLQNLIKNVPWILSNDKGSAYMNVDWGLLKPNTNYTFIVFNPSPKIDLAKGYVGKNFVKTSYNDISKPLLLTTVSSLPAQGVLQPHIYAKSGTLIDDDVANTKLVLIEGDYTNKPIPPYFEGIKSVNEDGENLEEFSCGKNLFDKTFEDYNVAETLGQARKVTFKLKPNTKYTVSTNSPKPPGTAMVFADGNNSDNSGVWKGTSRTITSNNAGEFFIAIRYMGYSDNQKIEDFFDGTSYIQIEEGTVATSYEPYIEHRLPIKMKNLRSLPNGVCDTSDGVRRIGKVIFSGGIDEKWEQGSNNTLGTTRYSLKVNNVKRKGALVCDNICVGNTYTTNDVIEINDVSAFVICKQFGSLDLFKAWLQSNPITLYYELETPTKEEGNTEELRTYDGITNIFTEGSLINPTISCKVPSNVQAVVMSLREENEALNNNVNTLQATTEENNLMNIETNVNQEARLTMLELGVI